MSDREQRLNEAIAIYVEAMGSGSRPDPDQFIRRYSEIADELRDFIADYERMNQVAAAPRPISLAGSGSNSELPQSVVDREATTLPPGSLIGNPPAPSDATPEVGSGPKPTAFNLQPPRLRYFGDYELIEEIARGGMGVVYRARQVSLNRIVAVKMILAGQLASPDDVRRFHTEAEAAAQLQHPNIVSIYEVGDHDGQHYFSMEYVDGTNLGELIRQNPLPAKQAAAIVKTVAEAVHYAHGKGILHRDLKPSNVLLLAKSGALTAESQKATHDSASTDSLNLRPPLSDLRPKITDFGLAKRIEGGSELTGTGQILGTPSYMPPEQATAKRGEIGAHSDVYALGAILYELLTGRPPFRAETPLDTLLQVLENEPASPRLLNPSTPSDLATVCLKCLEKQPNRRYQSAQELAQDLGRFLSHDPILARPAGLTRKWVSWTKRRPWSIVGIASLAVFALMVYSFWLAEQNSYLSWLIANPAYTRSTGSLTKWAERVVLGGPGVVLALIAALWHQGRQKGPGAAPAYSPGQFAVLTVFGLCGGIYAIAAVISGVKAQVWEIADVQRSLTGAYWSLYLGALVIWRAMQQRHVAQFGTSIEDDAAGQSNREWVAVSPIGTIVVLIVALGRSFPAPPRQGQPLFAFAVVIAASILFLLIGLKDAVRVLRLKSYVLVPVGVLLLASSMVNWVAGVPISSLLGAGVLFRSFTQAGPMNSFAGVGVMTAIGCLCMVFTAYAAWQTDLIHQAMATNHPVALVPWPSIRRGFWNAFRALVVGNGVALIFAVNLIGVNSAFVESILLGMDGLVIVLWNLATVALLPTAVIDQTITLRTSWRIKNRLWLPVIIQMLLLGLITHVSVRIDEVADSSKSITYIKTQTINAIWVGGYENDSRWYSDYTRVVKTTPMSFVREVQAILFLVLAVAMKIRVIQELQRIKTQHASL